MANNVLSASSCAAAEEVARKIAAYEGLIENCVQSFNYCIKNADVSAWVNDTASGAETLQKVTSNNNGLLQLGSCIEAIYQVTMSLIHQSEQIGSASNAAMSDTGGVNIPASSVTPEPPAVNMDGPLNPGATPVALSDQDIIDATGLVPGQPSPAAVPVALSDQEIINATGIVPEQPFNTGATVASPTPLVKPSQSGGRPVALDGPTAVRL